MLVGSVEVDEVVVVGSVGLQFSKSMNVSFLLSLRLTFSLCDFNGVCNVPMTVIATGETERIHANVEHPRGVCT